METDLPGSTVDGQRPQPDRALLHNSSHEFQINDMPPAPSDVLNVERCGMELCKQCTILLENRLQTKKPTSNQKNPSLTDIKKNAKQWRQTRA